MKRKVITLCVLLFIPLLVGVSVKQEPTPIYPVPLDAAVQERIVEICREYQVDPAIVIAIIKRESTFNPMSLGDSGASYGLMQVKAVDHLDRMARLGVTDLYDPKQNVLVGIDYFAELISRYNNISMALVAYNAGPGGAYTGWFSVGRYESDYSREVMHNAQIYSESCITIGG